MKKLPGQGGLTKKVATAIGKANRAKFSKEIESNWTNLLKNVNPKNPIAMEVVSFSSCNDYPEQILSILSFVKNLGVPLKWTIYSDGSHTDVQRKQMSNDFGYVEIKSINWEGLTSIEEFCCEDLKPYHKYVLDYAQNHAFGKRLFYYLNHPINDPTLFIDSDILFYEKANAFEILINENPKANGWFMPDAVWGCLDSRYKETHLEQTYQVNAGLMFVLKKFDNYKKALDFYKVLDSKYEYFSEQTIINILLKDNSFMPLTSKTFILDSGDQFDFSYLNKPKEMAVRHYTGPVRHKMWQKDYKWHLGL
jgi:hypothetical protein